MSTTNAITLNTILYGPPGTGKTYNAINYAVAIIEDKAIETVRVEAENNYAEVKNRFDLYKEQGRIAFTTFHQSYGYEDFIVKGRFPLAVLMVTMDTQLVDVNVHPSKMEVRFTARRAAIKRITRPKTKPTSPAF